MTFKPPKPTKAPEPRPDVEVDDHLYVHHAGQPCTCVVKAHGKHGVTVEIDGQHQQVRWDKVLGHKKRAQQRYDVVDQGEDGMLVQDASGRRRFIAVPNESKEDPMVVKALGRRPVLLFMKSQLGANPTQPSKVDQAGEWRSADKKEAPPQNGEHVGFVNGEHRGFGKVTGAGQHGVTVRDGKGGDHRILHDQVSHRWGGDGEPTDSPHDDADVGDDPLADFDGKTQLSPELVLALVREASPDLRKKVAECVAEYKAGQEVDGRAEAAAKLPNDVVV